MSEYPEHEKLKAVKELSQTCGEFVDFLEEKGIYLAEYDTKDERNRLYRWRGRMTKLLAEFFEIDEDALEREKQAMLEKIRS